MSANLERISQLLPKDKPEHAAFAQTVAELAKIGRALRIPEDVLAGKESAVLFEAPRPSEKPVQLSNLIEKAFEQDSQEAVPLDEFGRQFNMILGANLSANVRLDQLFLSRKAKIPSRIKAQYHRTLIALGAGRNVTVGDVRSLDRLELERKRNIGTISQEFILEAFRPAPQEKEE